VSQRINFLQKSLKSDQKGTKQWWYSWLGLYGVATVGQGAVFFTSNEKGTRQDMALGAATTFVGVLGQFISPFQPKPFADTLCKMSEYDPAERLSKMTQLEKLLTDRAYMETEARKWKAHLLPTAINLASGLVTWVGFHRTVWDGAANFALNCVITESQIWSQPIRAKRALRQYNERFDKGNVSILPTPNINWNFIVSANGVGICMIF
jgi:hypothetical protein